MVIDRPLRRTVFLCLELVICYNLFVSDYTDEALYFARRNNVKVFFVNMGSTPLRSDLVSFAKATGGAVLSSSPQAMWEELKSYQG